MSRDFKQEYEQYMNDVTPELWARIEKNLPAKETAKVTEISHGKRRKINTGWMTCGMTAAAALAIFVLAVPTLRNARDTQMEMTADYAPKMVYDAVVQEEAENCAEAEMDMGKSGSSASPKEQTPEMGLPENSLNDTEAAHAVSAEGMNKQSDTARVQAKVRILEILEKEGKTLFRAEWKGKEAILIFSPDFSGEAFLTEGTDYSLLLENADETVNWDYIITGIE